MARTLAIIPARGGSKRLPRKNIVPLEGKPLLAYSVEVALASRLFDKVLVSTEDADIAHVAQEAGAIVDPRPVELASDTALLTDVCLDILGRSSPRGEEYDVFCLLQPTCPLRTVSDLVASYQMLSERNAHYVVSVTEYEEPPFWSLALDEEGFLQTVWGPDFLKDRKVLPQVYKHNGSIIWARTEVFLREKTLLGGSRAVPYYMPRERSVDIDHPLDLRLAELLLSQRRRTFRIGNKWVGEGCPVYIIFEAGQTHCGFENAKELIDAAHEAGADAIKFQVYDTDRLISAKDIMDPYGILVDRETGRIETVQESLVDSLQRKEMTPGEWRLLKQHADSRGITFFATVCFPEEVDMLMSLGVHVFKVSSGDVNHHSLIRYVARQGVPVMVDTGSSTIGEVEQAVDIIRAEGNDQIIIHHCPSGFPARLDSINLSIIRTLKSMFSYPIAFSDHSPGWDMDIAAVALGVNMVEKTITSDRTYPEAEHAVSVEVRDAERFVRAIRDLERALGKPRREMSAGERAALAWKRRSIFARTDLHPGDILTEDNVDYRRPGTGVPPDFYAIVLGRKVVRHVPGGSMLSWDDLG